MVHRMRAPEPHASVIMSATDGQQRQSNPGVSGDGGGGESKRGYGGRWVGSGCFLTCLS